MPLEREEVRAWLEGIQDVCGSDQVSWKGRFLSPAGIGKILRLGEAWVPEGLLGQPWALVCCPHPGRL